MAAAEDTNLVSSSEEKTSKKSYTEEPKTGVEVKEEEGGLKRHVTLSHAVAIMVGSIIGSGIFITPQMVFVGAGSVGAALLLWVATGAYIFLLAWCYMELGTRMPASGGEYVFNYDICGPMQGFLAFWVSFVIFVPATCGAVGQTAGVYLATAVGLDDNTTLCTLIADLIISRCNPSSMIN
jgi:amino acid transporter